MTPSSSREPKGSHIGVQNVPSASGRAKAQLLLLAAALIGSALLWLSDWVVPPAQAAFPGHGERFAAMAQEPFALTGDFPQRKLWPVLAWLFSFVGVSAPVFTQICSGALLTVICRFARVRTGRWDAAVLVTAAMAASGAVLVYKPMACFSDTLNLLLLVLLVQHAARPAVFWPLVFLSALSHELVFFFAPWLVYVRCRNGGLWWREGLLLVVVLAAYLAFRAPMAGSYGIAYYFDKNFWVPWLLPALWSLWLLVVVVEFGPLLLLAGFGLGRNGALAERQALGGRWGLLLYLGGLLPLMVLAYDVMRFATFAFLPVLLGGVALARSALGRLLLLGLTAAAVVLYSQFTHPNPMEQGGRHFTAVAADVFGQIVPRITGPGPFPFGESVAVTSAMFGSWWGVFAAVVAALVAAVVGGRLLARWCGSQTPRT
ncbi:MAG: hypothetical protein AB8H80_10105 [Planctomycetota bacterium]